MGERNLLLDEDEVAGELSFTSERRSSWRKMKCPSHAGKKERREREKDRGRERDGFVGGKRGSDKGKMEME